MKVLRKGRQQSGWASEASCTGNGNGKGGCGARLLVEQSDLFITESHCRDETTRYVTFQCPECKVLTDLTSSDEPGDRGHLLRLDLPSQKTWTQAHPDSGPRAGSKRSG